MLARDGIGGFGAEEEVEAAGEGDGDGFDAAGAEDFEVAVVRDAVAAPKFPEGDGYLAALINFRFIANAVWTTEETLARLHPDQRA